MEKHSKDPETRRHSLLALCLAIVFVISQVLDFIPYLQSGPSSTAQLLKSALFESMRGGSLWFEFGHVACVAVSIPVRPIINESASVI